MLSLSLYLFLDEMNVVLNSIRDTRERCTCIGSSRIIVKCIPVQDQHQT